MVASNALTFEASAPRSWAIPEVIAAIVRVQSGFVFGFPSIRAATAPETAANIVRIPSVLVCQCFNFLFVFLVLECYIIRHETIEV